MASLKRDNEALIPPLWLKSSIFKSNDILPRRFAGGVVAPKFSIDADGEFALVCSAESEFVL